MSILLPITLRDKLLTMSAMLVLLGIALMSFINVSTARHLGQEMLQGQMATLTLSHVNSIAEWVQVRKQLAAALAGAALDGDPLVASRLIKQAGQVDGCYIGYADKRVVAAEEVTLPATYDPTERPWYQLAA